MRIMLPYRKDYINLELPAERLEAVIEPNIVKKCLAPHDSVREALEKPYGGERFDSFLSAAEGGGLLVIVNDGTRPTPTRLVLEALSGEFEAAGARFIIATGAHRGPTEEELRFIFGSTLELFRGRISVHDARSDRMFSLGTTSGGTEVLFNEKVREADKILIIGSVEPHYFAGYTGGRKGLLPGVSAYSTIEQNHRKALSSDACTLVLDKNPVHQDMMEACRMLDKEIFTIMTVLDRNQDIYAVTAGGLEEAFAAAVKKADEVYVVPIECKAELVVACAKYPMDIDLYQSQKAIENAKLALKPCGTLLLVSACRDGIGDDLFSRLLSSCNTSSEVFHRIEGEYRLGYHKAAKIADICGWAKIAAYTELDDSVLKDVFMEPVSDLQATVSEVLESSDAGVIIMPDASVTVPEYSD